MMKIKVKMIANYRMVLPPEAKNGIVELDVPEGATVYDAVSRFDIPLDDESVIVLNGLTVDLSTPLREGDTVTAFSAIAGGSIYITAQSGSLGPGTAALSVRQMNLSAG